MGSIATSNKMLVDFLLSMDYGPHNKSSANKILSIIPKSLHYYWFRGLIDGDGCFYTDIEKRLKQFVLAGPYEQNWEYIKDLFNELDIKSYAIRKNITKDGKNCNVCVSNYYDIIKIGNYIYQNYEIDGIGLNRKYNKFTLIKSNLIPKLRGKNKKKNISIINPNNS